MALVEQVSGLTGNAAPCGVKLASTRRGACWAVRLVTWWVVLLMLLAGLVTPQPYNYRRLKALGKGCFGQVCNLSIGRQPTY